MNTSLPNTIGVELEFASDQSFEDIRACVQRRLTRNGIHTPVVDINDYGPGEYEGRHWHVKDDGSCYTDDASGIEITSPPLTNRHFEELKHVCAAASTVGRVHNRCGTHVHHRFAGLRTPQFQGVLASWLKFEPFLFKLVSNSRRANTYCREYSTHIFPRPQDVFAIIREPRDTSEWERYYGLNTTHWWRTGRFEVRIHQGSLDAEKIWNWAHLTQHFINAGSTITNAAAMPEFDSREPIKTQIQMFRAFLGLSMTPSELEFFDAVIPERLAALNSELRADLGVA